MNSKSYFLPDGYQENPAITYDTDARAAYWNSGRRLMSRSYQRAVYDWAQYLIRTYTCQHIADVGCGFADKFHALAKRNPHAEFYGIDQPSIINVCQEVYDRGHWLSVNLEDHPVIPDTKFDLVISSDVIEHLADPDKLLHFIKQIIRKDGYILISTPERDVIRGKNCLASTNKHHVREWNAAEFQAYIRSRGFKIIEHRILPGFSPFFSLEYLRQRFKYWRKGINVGFNQAVLLQVTD